MKILFNILVAGGLLLLVGGVVGKFVGRPQILVGLKVMNFVLLANTAILLAILVKLFEKN